MIRVRLEGEAPEPQHLASELHGVSSIEVVGDELVVCSDAASKVVGPLAVALDRRGVAIRDLHLTSPSLDDVFFSVTGEHFDDESVT